MSYPLACCACHERIRALKLTNSFLNPFPIILRRLSLVRMVGWEIHSNHSRFNSPYQVICLVIHRLHASFEALCFLIDCHNWKTDPDFNSSIIRWNLLKDQDQWDFIEQNTMICLNLMSSSFFLKCNRLLLKIWLFHLGCYHSSWSF